METSGRSVRGAIALAFGAMSVVCGACGGSASTGDNGGDAGQDEGTLDAPSGDTIVRDASRDSSDDTAPTPDTGVDARDGSTSGCPPTMPTSGSCSPVGLVCGYGDDPRPRCRSSATCTSAGWEPSVGGCPPPPTETCPPTESAAKGSTCTTVGAFCTYGDSICGCGNCFAGPCGGTPKWACDDGPADPACPRRMPNLGVSCSPSGLRCVYGSCATGTIAGRVCTGGVWTDEPQACPL